MEVGCSGKVEELFQESRKFEAISQNKLQKQCYIHLWSTEFILHKFLGNLETGSFCSWPNLTLQEFLII